jgi:hypothetical protein
VKKFDYVYFNIYQYYSSNSHISNAFAVRLKCMYLLSLSAGGWILFLQSIFFRFIRHGWFASQFVGMVNALSIYTIITYLFYRIFIVEERDQKIFDKYINAWEENPNKKRDLFVTSFIAAVPYVAMIGIKIFIRCSMVSS